MRFISLAILLVIVPFISTAADNYTLNDDLLYRINFGSADDVKVLLDKGANPNARTRQGETAFNVAMERNDKESERMAMFLVEKGADLEAPDKDGNLPIIVAVKYKLTEVVKLMLTKGANYHVTAPDGTSLIEYAKKNGDKETVDAIQELIGKEEAIAASLRTPERFHEMARAYTMDSCTYQYWSFFVASRQAPEKDAENQKKVDQAKANLYQIISEIEKYYAPSSASTMLKVANQGVGMIYDQLDSMISNTNRAEHGVGRDEDAKERCEKILAGLPIDIEPVAVNPAAPAAPGSVAPPPPPPVSTMRLGSTVQLPVLDQTTTNSTASPIIEVKPTAPAQ